MESPEDIASPWDLVTHSRSPLHPRLRRLVAASEPPGGLPFGFTLGGPIAPGNDWSLFAEEASARGAVSADHRVLVIHEAPTPAAASDFVASLDAQMFAGEVSLRVQGAGATDTRHAWDPEVQAEIADRLGDFDTVIYVTGVCTFDPLTLERVCRMTRVSRLLVLPLAEADARPLRPSVVPGTVDDWQAERPDRTVRGLNFAMSTGLARSLGPLAFDEAYSAGRRHAHEAWRQGAYFVPVFVPRLEQEGEVEWRETSPRISVIIPLRAPSLGAGRSIISLLRQSEQDVEIVVWSERPVGQVWAHFLKARFGGRIRSLTAGTLNEVIEAVGGDYVGVLAAGDRLAPNALAGMLERLESDASVAVVQLKPGEPRQDSNWKRTTDRRLSTACFPVFRRATWGRAGDRRNADLLSLLLALSGLGQVETARTPQLIRSRMRLPSESLEDADKAPSRVRAEAKRRGLTRYWQIGATPAETASARAGNPARLVIAWPDYSGYNAYQRLLYGPADDSTEYVAGDIEAAIRATRSLPGTAVAFHLHWTARIFRSDSAEGMRSDAAAFLERLREFKQAGGTVIWTIHNIANHNTSAFDVEIDLARALVEMADRVHVHSIRSLPEIETYFSIPREKLRIARHGDYVGTNADFTPRSLAREQLGIAEDEQVLLFTGLLRPYKGLGELIATARSLFSDYPRLKLILAGDSKGSEGMDLLAGLSEAERERIVVVNRFLDNDELQLYFRAADAGVYPYDQVLTSGSVMLALSFDLPVVAPRFGMIEESVDEDRAGGVLYDVSQHGALERALREILRRQTSTALGPRGTVTRDSFRAKWVDFTSAVIDSRSAS